MSFQPFFRVVVVVELASPKVDRVIQGLFDDNGKLLRSASSPIQIWKKVTALRNRKSRLAYSVRCILLRLARHNEEQIYMLRVCS
ncbi:hypothetical protein ACHQM5_005877 [Ranunculus cassubicifolius]